MPTPSPYRSLPPERRLALVMHTIKASREGRELYVQRLAARSGFRPVTLKTWSADRLAKEIVRMKAENANDELDLLQLLYVDLEPDIQIAFLDAAGVTHEKGVIPEDLERPYADADGVRRGAAAVREQHGEDGERYLRTIAKYSHDAWPGIDTIVAEKPEA
jgi:hypothetical protein